MNNSRTAYSPSAPTGQGSDLVQTVVDLFGSYRLHRRDALMEGIEGPSPSGARGWAYPTPAVLAIHKAWRVVGSPTQAQMILADEETWQQCRKAYFEASGVVLPKMPPSAHQVLYYTERLYDRLVSLHGGHEASKQRRVPVENQFAALSELSR